MPTAFTGRATNSDRVDSLDRDVSMNAAIRTFSRQMATVLACGAFSAPMTGRYAHAADADCGYATCTDMCCDDCMSCGECCKCCGYGHCTAIWGEFLFLHPTGADLAHAQQ